MVIDDLNETLFLYSEQSTSKFLQGDSPVRYAGSYSQAMKVPTQHLCRVVGESLGLFVNCWHQVTHVPRQLSYLAPRLPEIIDIPLNPSGAERSVFSRPCLTATVSLGRAQARRTGTTSWTKRSAARESGLSGSSGVPRTTNRSTPSSISSERRSTQ